MLQKYKIPLKIPLIKVLICAKYVQILTHLNSNPLNINNLYSRPSRLGGVWSPVRVWSPRHADIAMCEAVRVDMGSFVDCEYTEKCVYNCLYMSIKMCK